MKTNEENGKIIDYLLKRYNEKKFVELEIELMKQDVNIRSEVVNNVYNQGDLRFVQKYIKAISPKLRNEILVYEYKKGNIDFVYKNFGSIDNGDLKETILERELTNKNYNFLYENYQYIYNKDVRDKIIKNAYKEENIDFLNMHIQDMPKSMKLEAAIKFKNLKLSKEELEDLLRR